MHGHAPYHAMRTEYTEGMRHGSGSASHFQVYAAMHDHQETNTKMLKCYKALSKVKFAQYLS